MTSSRGRMRMGPRARVIGRLARISGEAPELLYVIPLKEGELGGSLSRGNSRRAGQRRWVE
jgi:hypothetical protein